MKPVFQKHVSTVDGDCIAACVASILELPLSAVPNWLADATAAGDFNLWHGMFLDWMFARGLHPIEIFFKDLHDYRPVPGLYVLASMPSQRFPGGAHCVVGTWINRGSYNSFAVAHDPNSGNVPYTEDVKPQFITFLIPTIPVIRISSGHSAADG